VTEKWAILKLDAIETRIVAIEKRLDELE